MQKGASKKFSFAFGVFAAVGLACMAALVVVLILFGLNGEKYVLYGILGGSFAGGAILFGLLAYFCLKKGEELALKELDERERADGEESFFVGEDTLARFGKDALTIVGKTELKLNIPYAEMKFYSVCTRRAPEEKGEWSVLMQFPARYLPKARKDDPPVLIQTDGKKRLYDCLSAHALSLIGELPEGQNVKKKYERLQKFNIPDPVKRKRATLIMLFGGLLVAGGVGFAFYMATVGAVVAVIGGYVLFQGGVSFGKAKRVFAVYREGLFLREQAGQDSCFLKWEEIDRLRFLRDGERGDVLRLECPYGAYEFPCPQDAYEFLKSKFPQKFEE